MLIILWVVLISTLPLIYLFCSSEYNPDKRGRFRNNSNSCTFDDSRNWRYSHVNINSSPGGIFPILIIILCLLSGSSDTNIEAFPDAMLSVYFSSALFFLITFDFTSLESPILTVNEEKT